MDPGDPELVRELVEVHVAAFGEPAFEPDPPVPAGSPVTVLVGGARKTVVSLAQDAAEREVQGLVEPGEGEKDLGHGPRWVLAVQGAVEHGPAAGAAQLREARPVDPVDEGVGIEGGGAREGEQRAVARVDGDDRAHLPGEGLERPKLKPHVQPERDGRPRDRFGRVDRPHHPPPGIDLHLLDAGVPVQRSLPRVLHARLPDVARGAIVRIALEPAPLRGVDPTHVAHHVGERLAEGVLAHEPGVDVDPREAVPVDGEDGDLPLVEAGLEGNALEPRKVAHLVSELLFFRLVDDQDLAQEPEGPVHATRLLRHDLQAEDGEVASQHHPVPIPHQAAGRRDGTDPDPVLVGQGRVVLVLHDLEVAGPQQEGKESRAGETGPGDDPRAIAAPLARRAPAKRVKAHEVVRGPGGA